MHANIGKVLTSTGQVDRLWNDHRRRLPHCVGFLASVTSSTCFISTTLHYIHSHSCVLRSLLIFAKGSCSAKHFSIEKYSGRERRSFARYVPALNQRAGDRSHERKVFTSLVYFTTTPHAIITRVHIQRGQSQTQMHQCPSNRLLKQMLEHQVALQASAVHVCPSRERTHRSKRGEEVEADSAPL